MELVCAVLMAALVSISLKSSRDYRKPSPVDDILYLTKIGRSRDNYVLASFPCALDPLPMTGQNFGSLGEDSGGGRS